MTHNFLSIYASQHLPSFRQFVCKYIGKYFDTKKLINNSNAARNVTLK